MVGSAALMRPAWVVVNVRNLFWVVAVRIDANRGVCCMLNRYIQRVQIMVIAFMSGCRLL